MTAILSHIRNFAVLFLAVTLLISMVPRQQFGKYIRFFAQMVLVLGFLYPILNGLFGSEDFLKLLDEETFSEELEQLALDSGRLTFLQNDYYVAQYEDAAALDVKNKAESYGYPVESVDVELLEDYTIKKISVVLKEDGEEIIIGKILLSEEEQEEGWNEKRELAKILSEYYGVEDDKIVIVRSAE